MTFVLARKFASRLVVLSDTMVSDPNGVRSDTFPGLLKSIVVSTAVSIAYAGNVAIASEAIKKARDDLWRTNDLDSVVERLRQITNKYSGTKWACDFIVTSHLNSAQMYKIWDGKVSSGAHEYWIGNPAVSSEFLALEATAPPPTAESLEFYGSIEEYRFHYAAEKLWSERGTQITPDVGGLKVIQVGKPSGHCYMGHAASVTWDTVYLPQGLTEQQRGDRISGMTQFCYSLVAAPEDGIAVIGGYFEQPRVGYVYSPFETDEPIARYAISYSEFVTELRARSNKLHNQIRSA